MNKPDKPLKGFENIKRYWDNTRSKYCAKILPGEYYVTNHNELITTVLGSCISACIRDPIARVGGMNHFMLPQSTESGHTIHDNGIISLSTRYGNWAMEHMINDILKNGGDRNRLEIKIFGGGSMWNTETGGVGDRNIKFIVQYLHTENLTLHSHDYGGPWPRKILYDPISGKVLVKKLEEMHNQTIKERESSYQHTLTDNKKIDGGDVDLF